MKTLISEGVFSDDYAREGGMQEFRSGIELRAARILAGVTQNQIAIEAGVHPKTIAYWEKRNWAGMHGELKKAVTKALARRGVYFLPGEDIAVALRSPIVTPK